MKLLDSVNVASPRRDLLGDSLLWGPLQLSLEEVLVVASLLLEAKYQLEGNNY